jgi:hypothetical protein
MPCCGCNGNVSGRQPELCRHSYSVSEVQCMMQSMVQCEARQHDIAQCRSAKAWYRSHAMKLHTVSTISTRVSSSSYRQDGQAPAPTAAGHQWVPQHESVACLIAKTGQALDMIVFS